MPVSLTYVTTTIIASLVLAVTLAAPAAATIPSFDPPTGLDLAGNANAVAVGDFDGDGLQDLAAGYGLAAGAVSLWLGTGNPVDAFEHRSPDVAAGVSPRAAAVGDFNGDGRDDLAVANAGPAADAGDDDVTILLGGPNGLVRGETLPVRDAPNAIDGGDLDGDGDLDLVVASFGSAGALSVLAGDGNGHFEATQHDVGCRAAGATLADLVAGGGQEVGVACSDLEVVRIFAPDAGSTLRQVGSDHPACDSSPVSVAAGNFDGLGKADLAVVCLTHTFTVLGSEAGFAPLPGPDHTTANPQPVFPTFSPSGLPQLISLETADVNRDGFDDVLATDVKSGRAVVADGRANARFLPETGPAGARRVGSAFSLDPALAQVTAADVNEDGKPDVVGAAGNRIVIRYATTPVPGVRTGSASSVGHGTATVGAVVNPSGTQTANETTYRFEYGTTAAYGQTTAALPEGRSLAGDSYVPVSAVLGGLAPQTEYHYRVVASNGNGTTYGRDRIFWTGATPPPQAGGNVQAADTTRPRLALSAPRTITRAKLLRKGVRVTVVPNEQSTLAIELVGSSRIVRLARVGDVILAERRLPLTAARRSVTLKLPQRFRSRLSRRFRLMIRVTATDAAGNRIVTTRALKVR